MKRRKVFREIPCLPEAGAITMTLPQGKVAMGSLNYSAKLRQFPQRGKDGDYNIVTTNNASR